MPRVYVNLINPSEWFDNAEPIILQEDDIFYNMNEIQEWLNHNIKGEWALSWEEVRDEKYNHKGQYVVKNYALLRFKEASDYTYFKMRWSGLTKTVSIVV